MRKMFNINSKVKELELNPGDTLLHVLRENGYTEVKCGCNEGECGACVIMVDGKPVNPKATELYRAICIPGTMASIHGDVAIVWDGDFA